MSPHRAPHRCMNRTVKGRGAYVHKDGYRRSRPCLTRKTFNVRRQPPPCPGCGSREHWQPAKRDRRADRARETCNDGLCPYHYPHTVYSAGCIHNPTRAPDPYDMTERPGTLARSDEVPF